MTFPEEPLPNTIALYLKSKIVLLNPSSLWLYWWYYLQAKGRGHLAASLPQVSTLSARKIAFQLPTDLTHHPGEIHPHEYGI